ncbi:hypothetical protein [Nocardia bovistercoris]|uniref:Uncharacterized protein n=1 Tax=Nocardia bovistercoris TaxID=2785916 RepID=A0A931MZH1_9NOCA|nr:hypothetical protein [Nocardia bovistercoris]MBH0776135.1 hypothetical protein [Nocardia bovistercoris]
MGDICVDPDGARQAGAAISANTADSRARVETQFDEAAPAAQANEGWKTGPALVDFAYIRKRDILSCLDELDSIGQKIIETITVRVRVDQSYATSLDRVGKAVDAMSE